MTPVFWVTLVLLCIGTICDLRHRQIPDAVSFALMAVAALSTALGWTHLTWVSLLMGVTLAFAIGLFLFWRGGFGGGDVKVLTSVGAIVGLPALLPVLFFTALAGGAIAVIALARGTRDVPYVPAMTVGFLLARVTEGLS